jgi:beta-glucosidase
MNTLYRHSLFITILVVGISSCKTGNKYDFAFQDPRLSPEARAEDLVKRLTLEEKILQMQNSAPAIERLGVPAYNWWSECLHGVGRAGFATVFPQAIGMAATWDPRLVQAEADVISTEARAKHHEFARNGSREIYQGLTFWSPNINIFRDPRWGRGQETFGEDPYLTSRIGVAFVKGLQGTDSTYLKVVSTPKHFAVHSGPEPDRHTFDARPGLRDFYETYLPAFEACVKEGKAASVMGAYNRVYGEPCCASKLLLQDILRGRWGFRGYVVSDCGAISDMYQFHKVYETEALSAAFAVKAGCDLTCGGEYASLREALTLGLVREEDLDASLVRLFAARFRLGMFDPPEKVSYAQIPITANDTRENSDLARKVAQESIVLLKNDNHVLPISPAVKSIAVIGPYADDVDVLLGNYNGTPSAPVTLLDGIRRRAGNGISVAYRMGIEPLERTALFGYVESANLLPPGGQEENGLLGEYFNDPDLKGSPAISRIDREIRFWWEKGSPDPKIRRDYFSARWTGYLVAEYPGDYEIGVSSDDRSRLFIDDSLLVDNWDSCVIYKVLSRTVTLEKGVKHKVRIEYAEIDGHAGISFKWKRKVQDQALPAMIAEAVDLARRSDLVIMVGGISPMLEGEELPLKIEGFLGGDRTSLGLPAAQLQLMKALKATGKPIVLVLTNGSALAVTEAQESLPAIVDVWYPGQQGGNALADVLFGDYNPAGRLPVTFYRSVSDLPPFDDYNMKGRTYKYFEGHPLYPFGHGLSYTSFEYIKAVTGRTAYAAADTAWVTVTLRNAGDRDGDEVVQVYADKNDSRVARPIKWLVGFDRIHLKAGQTLEVKIPVCVQTLRYYDEDEKDYRIEPGLYNLHIGCSSADIKLTTSVAVH